MIMSRSISCLTLLLLASVGAAEPPQEASSSSSLKKNNQKKDPTNDPWNFLRRRKHHDEPEPQPDDNNDNGDNNDNQDGGHLYMGAIVTIDHVMMDAHHKNDWNRNVIVDALVDADNVIHTNSNVHATSGFIEKYADIPETEPDCEDDPNHHHGGGGRRRLSRHGYGDVYWMWVNYECGFMCGYDDDFHVAASSSGSDGATTIIQTPLDLLAEVSNGRTPSNHQALEGQLCATLRASGEEALSSITECTIDYVYNQDEFLMRHGPPSLVKAASNGGDDKKNKKKMMNQNHGASSWGPSFGQTVELA